MTTPHYPDEHRADRARADTAALVDVTGLLRQLANADRHLDARRGDVSRSSLAALVEAVGRHDRSVPHEIATCAMQVVNAVDRATGTRRR